MDGEKGAFRFLSPSARRRDNWLGHSSSLRLRPYFSRSISSHLIPTTLSLQDTRLTDTPIDFTTRYMWIPTCLMTDRASSSTLSLPRASSLEPLRVSGRASPPAILRWYDTTPREMENEKGEEERERKRKDRRKRARKRVEAECVSPHYTDYVPLTNISRCIDAHTLAKIRQKERLPYAYYLHHATWYLTFLS